jgi:transcriptional regulatory protein RtcR
VLFNAEARRAFIRVAAPQASPEAIWAGNFRELSAAITRMATLADGGRISEQLVSDEIARLRDDWTEPSSDILADVLPDATLDELDAFDRMQLESVVRVCRRSRSLADAGRALFGASRSRRGTINDSDRLRKYLARFDLEWATLFEPSA